MKRYNKDEAKFFIIRAYAKEVIYKRKIFVRKEDFQQFNKLGDTGRVLTDLLIKEADNHNSKLDAIIKKIQNLKFKEGQYIKSNLLKNLGINFRTIDLKIENYPEKDWYDIFLELKI